MVHCLPWDIINKMMCVSIRRNRDENVMCQIQTWVGKGRANHIANFDLGFFSEFFFSYSYLFPAIPFIFCSWSLLPCRLARLPEALLLSVCHHWISQDIAFLMPFLATETRVSVQINSYFLIPPCCYTVLLFARVQEWIPKQAWDYESQW